MRPLSGACLLALALPAIAHAQQIEFSGRAWDVRGEDVVLETYLGREALRVRNSRIELPDVDFENGTIEFDITTTGHRSFIGVAFRIEEPGNYEDFYLRPHNSGRFDAMQYTPVYNSMSAWQLYPEYNANFDIPTGSWLHVKLVISGSEFEVYFDDAATPALTIEELKRGRSHGRVALRAFFPAGEPEDFYPTAFANFVLTPDSSPSVYELNTRPMPPEFISRWAISPGFAAPDTVIRELPGAVLEAAGWTTAVSESSGLINLARHAVIPDEANRVAILARVTITSDREQTKKLNFGFSDQGSIFLNGRIIFSGNNTYRSRSQRYLGVVTVDNDAVYLPLRRGANELVVAVTEAFGGWGLIARFEDVEGITVRPERP